MELNEILEILKAKANPENVKGMARFGINSEGTLGISVTELRKIGKGIKKSHRLALSLWDTGIHEARILSTIIDIPKEVSQDQMDKWVLDFDSWDICDLCCMNLFVKTPYAISKSLEWCRCEETYVKRAGFAMIAALSLKKSKTDDESLIKFLDEIFVAADDERNFVKKAVNWALRQIGKRNIRLNALAIVASERILAEKNTKASHWIANDALKELNDPKILKRIT